MGRKLAWYALISSVAGWVMLPLWPFGFEIAAIILGGIAIAKADREDKLARRLAVAGITIGALKLLAAVGLFAYVVICFMRNPVAH